MNEIRLPSRSIRKSSSSRSSLTSSSACAASVTLLEPTCVDINSGVPASSISTLSISSTSATSNPRRTGCFMAVPASTRAVFTRMSRLPPGCDPAETVAEIVERELLAGDVDEVGQVHLPARIVLHVRLDDAHRQSEPGICRRELGAIARREIVVGGYDVHRPTGERMQRRADHRGQRLPFACVHLHRPAAMHRDAGCQLNDIRTHAERPRRRRADYGRGRANGGGGVGVIGAGLRRPSPAPRPARRRPADPARPWHDSHRGPDALRAAAAGRRPERAGGEPRPQPSIHGSSGLARRPVR